MHVNDFAAGLAHPLSGADHILAMVAIGLWGVVAGGRALWAATSIVVLGLAVRAPVWFGAVVAGLFAFFHGHAHGTEAATAGVELIAYASGFLLATAALHVVGLGAGLLIARSAGEPLLRATGGLVAVSGLAVIAGLA